MGTAEAAAAAGGAADSWEELLGPGDRGPGSGSLLQQQLHRQHEAELALLRADGLRLAPQARMWHPKASPLPLPGQQRPHRPLQPAAQRTQPSPARAGAEPSAEADSSSSRAGEHPARQHTFPSHRQLFPPAPHAKQPQRQAWLPLTPAPAPERCTSGGTQLWSAFLVPTDDTADPALQLPSAQKRKKRRGKGGSRLQGRSGAVEARQQQQHGQKPRQLWSALAMAHPGTDDEQQQQRVPTPGATADERQHQQQARSPPPLARAGTAPLAAMPHEAAALPGSEPALPAVAEQPQQPQQPSQLTDSPQPGPAGSRPASAGISINPSALQTLAGCLAASEPGEWAQRLQGRAGPPTAQSQQQRQRQPADLDEILQQLGRQRASGSPTRAPLQSYAAAAALPAATHAAETVNYKQLAPSAAAAAAPRPSLPWSRRADEAQAAAPDSSAAPAPAEPSSLAPDASALPAPLHLLDGLWPAAEQQPAAPAPSYAEAVEPAPVRQPAAAEPAGVQQQAAAAAEADAWGPDDEAAAAAAAELALQAAPDNWEQAADDLGIEPTAATAALLAAPPVPAPALPPTLQLAMEQAGSAAALEASEAPAGSGGAAADDDELDPLLLCLLPAPASGRAALVRPAAYRPLAQPGANHSPPSAPLPSAPAASTPAAMPQLALAAAAEDTPAEEEEEAAECLICFDDVPPQALAACVPCGHRAMCAACAPGYLARARSECPLCRADLAGMQAGASFLAAPQRWGRSV